MDSYLLLKLLHILSAIMVMGTGAGIAFFMFMAYRSKNMQAISVTARNVILGDWIFTFPAVIIQFVTGLLLMEKLNYSYTSLWFYWVVGLFIFIGACWVPVIRIQYLLFSQAKLSLSQGKLTDKFNRYMVWWISLGIPAFLAIIGLLFIMVFKPFPIV
ncbi:DUF2269 family protein [Kangiella koreensis]|uniref:Integral membrane protein n=1 Tax=Kangiella koreensis (strain DSM 16069 / JCM 12317 / KCTC 12182 / SW-125) TaxID=523791 RepID=C7R8T6_KANKD|nr:DUF2269 domain-containing protein [Kangiella koreensis]ACV25949.1 conserved hypothetical protein [Kangiella koreensis DSM 16069]